MKRTLAIALAVVVTSPFAFSQSTARQIKLGQITDSEAVQSATAPRPDGSVEEELIQTYRSLIDALLKGDVPVFDRLLADELTNIGIDGKVLTKAQTLELIRSGPASRFIDSWTIEDVKVRVYAEAAVLTSMHVTKGKNSSAKPLYFRVTAIFIKRDGRWQIVAGQHTVVQQP
jgi:hypothetical protein